MSAALRGEGEPGPAPAAARSAADPAWGAAAQCAGTAPAVAEAAPRPGGAAAAEPAAAEQAGAAAIAAAPDPRRNEYGFGDLMAGVWISFAVWIMLAPMSAAILPPVEMPVPGLMLIMFVGVTANLLPPVLLVIPAGYAGVAILVARLLSSALRRVRAAGVHVVVFGITGLVVGLLLFWPPYLPASQAYGGLGPAAALGIATALGRWLAQLLAQRRRSMAEQGLLPARSPR